MKKLITAGFAALILTTIFLACSRKENNLPACAKPGATAARGKANGATVTDVSCKGNCSGSKSCSLEIVGNAVQCNCSACFMQVIVYKADSAGVPALPDTTILPEGQVEVQYATSFANHMAAAYPGQTYDISKVTIVCDNDRDNYFITYSYVVAGGIAETISFEHEGATGKSMSVDCKGTCDCRERYIPASGSIECTCTSDCKMEIKQIASSAWDAQ